MSKVKVRIAVAVDKHGRWNACGWSEGKDQTKMDIAVESVEDGENRYWLEAELDIPTEATVVDVRVERDGEQTGRDG